MQHAFISRTSNIIIALVATLLAMIGAYIRIGLPPVIIVGGSGLIGLFMWTRTYLDDPLDPHIILPPFLLTVAGLEVHMAEEYLTGFGPAISRLFDASWTERSFLMVFAFVGPAIYSLTALGLFYRIRLAGFVAWFIFIGPGVAELTHFVFPLLEPAILPNMTATVSSAVSNGHYVADMPNYWLQATGRYYFPGLYTAVLPMIPGIWAIVRMLRASRGAARASSQRWVGAAALLTFFIPGTARAELVDSLAATSFENYPSAADSRAGGETGLNVFRASVGAPLFLTDDTTLVVGAAYERIGVEPSASGSFQLQGTKATLGVIQNLSEHWGMMAFGDVGLTSDFAEGVGSDDLLLSFTGIATYRWGERIQLGAGIIYDRRSGELAPLPALLVNLHLSSRARIRGFVPVWLNAEYRATSWLDVGVRSSYEGNRFHVAESRFGASDVELAYSNLTVGPKLTFHLSDWMHFDAYMAGAVYRRYELFQQDDRFARSELAPVMGFGARFLVAPSGW
jgi:hypothetical protein